MKEHAADGAASAPEICAEPTVDPMEIGESLATVFGLAIGTMFAHLTGAGILERDDAADRIRSMALTIRGVSVPRPQIAHAVADCLIETAGAIGRENGPH